MAGKTSHLRYSRIPDSVLLDCDLTPAARCVYAFLARHVFEGKVARLGQRLIARKLGLNRETVESAIRQLAKRDHLVVVGDGKSRRMYVLSSDIFGQKQGIKTIIRSSPRGKRMVSVAAEDVA